jgi:hypothetical protein
VSPLKHKKWLKILGGLFLANLFIGVVIVPRIWEARNVPAELREASLAAIAEEDLSAAVQARCGAITREVTLVVAPLAELGWAADPPGAVPEGYLRCAAEQLGADPLGTGAVTLSVTPAH